MTASTDLLLDAYGRVRDLVDDVVDGLSPEELATRLDEGANSIAWLVWHLARVEDDHVADVAGTEQVWTAAGWHEAFGLPFGPGVTGYGHGPEEVAAVRGLDADALRGYHDAVHERSAAYLSGLADADFARVVDTSWTPHVTLGVRLVSVVNDATQHVGQAAFVRGVLLRRRD
ncbi:mycothiol transferase [Streptomyces millisiae]|uniref:DUF664 domain-containing protein n=1 Tax=Streptomyces millisiae TaxID=3075542 RepID=A0ABU2LQV6_9ACTN|nr:DinB family protein [Streptomyces sp. DSM 44918]MDT0319964.1 DUF664 domain-containing protein [Streptomyces sp. DSM 44918]